MKDLLYENLLDAMSMIDEDKTQYYAKEMIKKGCSPHEILDCLNEGHRAGGDPEGGSGKCPEKER